MIHAPQTARRHSMRMVLQVSLLSLVNCALVAAPQSSPREEKSMLSSFQAGADGWQRRTYGADGKAVFHSLSTNVVENGEPALELPVSLPGDNEFVLLDPGDLPGWRELQLEFQVPSDFPARAGTIYMFTKNWDYLWRQIQLPLTPDSTGIVRCSLPLSGEAAAQAWSPRGHKRPWHALTPQRIQELGFIVRLRPAADPTTYEGTLRLRGVKLLGQPSIPPRPRVRQFSFSPSSPRVGETCEFRFNVEGGLEAPFDGEMTDVTAEFSLPDGGVETVRGFYCEDFLMQKTPGKPVPALIPDGAPDFRIRYTPRRSGTHQVIIQVRLDNRQTTLPPLELTVREAAADYRGFVRVDSSDRRFFAYEDGSPFRGIGINVRSPFDTRYLKNAPYSEWKDEGLALYERLFPVYRQHGINVVEVWMSSWWLALEWIPDAPGNHGVGHMNQYRAWKLDRIVEWAAENDIYLILVFNNHGKFGELHDTEWDRNPFNVENGGFLEHSEDYFSDERARDAFRRLCDYVVARWSASPHILAWKLFTEIDLTGSSYSFYKEPVVADWHKKMGGYLKSRDPYRHMITTHWMLNYRRINDAIADLEELDFLTTDAYYMKGGTRALLRILKGGRQYAIRKKKPLLITEYGGSPYADSMGNLIKQAHLGLWTGFFSGAPVPPFFWWFALVDEKNLYPHYRALHRFSRDVDRRNMTHSTDTLNEMRVHTLHNEDRALLWGFDTTYYLSEVENLRPEWRENVQLPLPPLAPGNYAVSIWNCRDASVRDRRKVKIPDGDKQPVFTLPAFRRDVALDIKRIPDRTASAPVR